MEEGAVSEGERETWPESWQGRQESRIKLTLNTCGLGEHTTDSAHSLPSCLAHSQLILPRVRSHWNAHAHSKHTSKLCPRSPPANSCPSHPSDPGGPRSHASPSRGQTKPLEVGLGCLDRGFPNIGYLEHALRDKLHALGGHMSLAP